MMVLDCEMFAQHCLACLVTRNVVCTVDSYLSEFSIRLKIPPKHWWWSTLSTGSLWWQAGWITNLSLSMSPGCFITHVSVWLLPEWGWLPRFPGTARGTRENFTSTLLSFSSFSRIFHWEIWMWFDLGLALDRLLRLVSQTQIKPFLLDLK